jgi:hypothetical protein
VEHPEGMSLPRGWGSVHSPWWGTWFPGMRASCNLVLGFRGNERDHSSACEKDSPREGTLREDWPVVDGSWRHAGAEELPCEL